MTFREFKHVIDGRKRAREGFVEQLAQHAAWIINNRTPALGERSRTTVTAAQLMGKGPVEVAEQFSSAEEYREHLRERAKAG